MTNKTSQELFAKFRDGSIVYHLPVSSSLRRAVIEEFDEEEDTSTKMEKHILFVMQLGK